MTRPPTYQVPRKDHPWRRYRNRPDDDGTELKDDTPSNIKPVKKFLTEIVESWESVEIITSAYGREGRFNLNELSQKKIAAWIVGVLKRNYCK